MNLVVLCAFIVIAAVSLIGTRPGHVWASFASILKCFRSLRSHASRLRPHPFMPRTRLGLPFTRFPLSIPWSPANGHLRLDHCQHHGRSIRQGHQGRIPNGSKLFVAVGDRGRQAVEVAPAASTDTFPVTVNFQKD